MGEDRPELAATLVDVAASPRSSEVDVALTRAESVVPDDRAPGLARGASIGRYLVLDVLGAGGMGVVYTAFDPQLDRKVAIKLVRPGAGEAGDSAGRGRMLREAQAIARIAHPNVVAVHDVGTVDDEVFIAMELVAGVTLAAWLHVRARSTREILDVVVQAGRGLAAAHKSGLVHRDFKPDNVLVDGDGRARVVDFGLVREAGTGRARTASDEPVRPSAPMLATPLTQVGAVMGTPLYAAPEQLRGDLVDARSDQYSFCVTLYEALAGKVPFPGASIAEITMHVLAGAPPPIAGARKVPAHVEAAIRRGLGVEPAARWPSMDALLAELGRDPAARRRRGLVAVGGVAVLAAAIAIPLATRGGAATPACDGGRAQLAPAWAPARRQALDAAFAATRAPYAAAAFAAVARQLDGYADRWVRSHDDSCRATHERHEQSLELLDLRTACLHQRRAELATFVELMLAVDAKTLARAHAAAAALSPIEDCDDLASLQAPTKLPADEPTRRAIAELREEGARISALITAGRYKDARVRTEAIVGGARALAYGPLEAEVLYDLGQILSRSGDPEGAHRALVDAVAVGLRSRHDERALRAAIALIPVSAALGQFARGHDWAALADALVERTGAPALRRSYVHHARAYLLSSEGKYVAAAAEYERARDLRARAAPGSQDLARSLSGLAHAYDEIGRYAEAREAGERSLALQIAELGPDHPEIAAVLNNLGNIAVDEGDLARATDYYERARVIRERTTLDGEDELVLANVYNNLGIVAFERARHDEALAHHRRALAIRERNTEAKAEVAMSLANIATVQRMQGDLAGALAGFERAREIAEAELGTDHPYVGDALHGIGECKLATRDYAAAQPALERALAIRKRGARPVEIADVEATLARVLWERGQQPRARELARSARAALAATPATRRQLAELDAWLATHR